MGGQLQLLIHHIHLYQHALGLNGSTGGALSPSSGYSGPGIANPQLAVDGSGNLWSANFDKSNVTEIIGIAAPVVTPLSVGVKNNTLGTRP